MMGFKQQHTTAILVFANSATEELRHKNIVRGSRLFDLLTRHTLSTVKRTGNPFFHISEDEQLGGSFGERFVNAIQSVFDKGFEKVITIGNDSPNLTKAHLDTALSNLETNKSVIGPSADGGFYLMGLHRTDFQKSDFESLSWQTSQVREEIVGVLSDSGKEIALLPTLFDIDTLWDVEILAKRTSGLAKNILNILRSIVSFNEKIKIPSCSYLDGFYIFLPHNKGSPIRTFS